MDICVTRSSVRFSGSWSRHGDYPALSSYLDCRYDNGFFYHQISLPMPAHSPQSPSSTHFYILDWTVGLLVHNGKLSGRQTYQDLLMFCFGKAGLITISIFQFIFAFGGKTISHSPSTSTQFCLILNAKWNFALLI